MDRERSPYLPRGPRRSLPHRRRPPRRRPRPPRWHGVGRRGRLRAVEPQGKAVMKAVEPQGKAVTKAVEPQGKAVTNAVELLWGQ